MPPPKGFKAKKPRSRDSNAHYLTLGPGLFSIRNFVSTRAGNTDVLHTPLHYPGVFFSPRKTSVRATLL